MFEKSVELCPGRVFCGAQQARYGEGPVGVGVGAAGLQRLVPEPAAQEARHEGVSGAEHVEDFDRKARALDPLLQRFRNGARKDDAAHRTSLEHQRRLARGAHRLQCGERVVRAAGDHHLLFRADDQVALGQNGAQALRYVARFDVALLAGSVTCKSPEIGPVIDVEDNSAPGGARQTHGLQLRGGGVGAGEMGAADQDRPGALDIRRIDVALVERAVGAIVPIKYQRKGLFVADAEQHQRGEPRGIGPDARDVDAFARALLADEPAHVLVADASDEAALEAETRRADGDVGRAASDGLGEARHVLQAASDLHAVEIDRRAADRDDVETRFRHGSTPV